MAPKYLKHMQIKNTYTNCIKHNAQEMSDYKRNPVTQVKNTKVDNEKYEVFNNHSNSMKTGKSSPQRRIHLTLKSLSISHISLQMTKYKLGQHFLLMSF